jgi:hypothetical protein
MKEDYFHDETDRVIYKLIDEYVQKYNKFPSTETLIVDLNNKSSLSEQLFSLSKEKIESFKLDSSTEIDWLVDTTEKWCQEKAVYNAIMKSIQILDNKDKQGKGVIPQLLSNALGVSFDSHIGHNWYEDAEDRFEFYHRVEERIPFNLEYFNKITKGGLPKKTLNVILAGCVHPETKVKIRIRKK